MAPQESLVTAERIEQQIHFILGYRVMLDADLAKLYEVEIRVLVQAVKRNQDRFPEDFCFQLTRQEEVALRSQIVTLNALGRGQHRKYLPYAFTGQGVAMLSTVLRSPRAIKVNVAIMRTFVRLRQMLASNANLARKLDALEKKYVAQFRVVFEAIRKLMEPPSEERNGKIGFHSRE